MYLASLTEETREMYNRWFDARGVPRPPRAEEMVLVRDDAELLGGVCMYITDGPYMFMEHFSTNPDIGGRAALEVANLALRSVTAYGTIRGKRVIAAVRDVGLINILQSRGYMATDHVVLIAPTGLQPVATSPEEDEQLVPKPEEEGGDMAKSRSKPRTRRKSAKKTEEG